MYNSSGIEINKSSLVSLKAEILRKQQELTINKLEQEQPEPSRLFKSKKKSKTHNEKRPTPDNEDEEILARSKQMLESKAILYDSLSKRSSNPTEQDKEITKRILVQFDRKDTNIDESDKEDYSYDYEDSENPEEQFVEYTDFLGRTRQCLRKDLEEMKKQDRDLSENIDTQREGFVKKSFVKDTAQGDEEKVENTNDNLSEKSEMLSSDMRRELMRREWEKQEEELLKKKHVHYQDILFNEARYHGAAYYAFSRDEQERIKQQEELNHLRQETTKQQESIAEMKKLREKQMAARLKAAKNRKRARMGLPPEPEECESETKVEVEKSQIDEEKQKIMAAKMAADKQREEERSKIVRPWDIGKEILKQHYEYSQEEWVTKQREQRPQEFAPPTNYSSSFHFKRHHFDDTENKSLFFTTKRSKIKAKTLDFSEQSSSNNYNRSNLEDSVMAGLRFLREQTEKQHHKDQ